MQWLFLFKPPGTSWDYTTFFIREFGASFRLFLFKLGTSMEFLRKEYCSGFPYSTPGGLPSHGTEATSLASLALTGRFFTTISKWTEGLLLCSWDRALTKFGLCFIFGGLGEDSHYVYIFICNLRIRNSKSWKMLDMHRLMGMKVLVCLKVCSWKESY